jgi:hypothetical protein
MLEEFSLLSNYMFIEQPEYCSYYGITNKLHRLLMNSRKRFSLILGIITFLLGTSDVRALPIVIDGSSSDWVEVPRLLTDPSGDVAFCGGVECRADTVGLRFAHDYTHVYLLYEFANDWQIEGAYLWLDTDMNTSTGCSLSGIGAEYGIVFQPEPSPAGMGDATACSFGFEYSSALDVASGTSFIEASIDLAVFEILSPGFAGLDVITQNDASGIGRYLLDGGETPTPLPTTLTLLGVGLLGLGYRRLLNSLTF